MPKDEEFISVTVTLKQEDIDYLKQVMTDNDQTRSQVVRAMIREHRAKNKKGGK